jgi:hypothetical protein
MMVTVTRSAVGRLLTLMFLSFVLGACGGGGAAPTTLSGYAVNGPLSGATVEILNSSGEKIGETETDSNGQYTIDVTIDPPYRIRTSGGTLDGAPYQGVLEAWCESAECHATPWTTLIVRLMDDQGFNAADAEALLASAVGIDYDPFVHQLLTGEPVPESAFNLTATRAALNGGSGLESWLSIFTTWLSNSNSSAPAGVPEPEPTPEPEPEPVTHTVSAGAGTGGGISPSSQSVVSGDTTTFTVTPNSGYEINSVSGCAGNLSGSTYTTGAITADCTVAASFRTIYTYTPPPTVTAPALSNWDEMQWDEGNWN